MPGMDGTGAVGYGPMTGGRRGPCAVNTAGGRCGLGAEPGWGGYGRRNQLRATGLTGRQRAAQDAAPTAPGADPLARIESALADVLDRLDRLEAPRTD